MNGQPVYFLALPGVLLLDLAGAAEAFRFAARLGGHYTLRFVGPADELCSSVGLALSRIDPLPDDVPDGALIVVPGLTDAAGNARGAGGKLAVEWLHRIWRKELELMTICSGAVLAGAAGILNGRRCTTHHTLTDSLRRIAPLAQVYDNRVFVIDGNIATSAGVTTGIDLALEMISRRNGPQIALEVARELVVWLRRDSASPQLSPHLSYRNHLHPAVHRVQDAIAANPAKDWPVDELARVACVSARHLTRLFKMHTGIGPIDYHQQLQLAQAELMLARRDWSLERIAEESGFGSARDLRRVWLRQRGTSLHR